MISPAYAQQSQVKIDSSRVQLRTPPAGKIHHYAQSQDFRYGSVAREKTSIWAIIAQWLWQKLAELLSYKSARIALKVLFYTLFVVFLIMLIRQFAFGGVFKTQNEPLDNFNVQQRSGNKQNWDPAIQKAIEEENFNHAVRLLYKKCLSSLQQHNLINWERRKTNQDYIYEINKPKLQQMFREVTRSYEYAEYGNFSISRQSFKRVRQQFNQIDRLLHQSQS